MESDKITVNKELGRRAVTERCGGEGVICHCAVSLVALRAAMTHGEVISVGLGVGPRTSEYFKLLFDFSKVILRKIINTPKCVATPAEICNRQLHECISKGLRAEPTRSVRIITVWPNKTLAAVTAVDFLSLE
jgi:hypothetical protein